MSDDLRKGVGAQIGEKVTPDSQKSTTQVAKENISGAADKVAATVQPESEKSTTQKISDSTRSNDDDAQTEGKTYTDSAKEIAGNVAQAASDTIISATDSLKGKSESAEKST